MDEEVPFMWLAIPVLEREGNHPLFCLGHFLATEKLYTRIVSVKFLTGSDCDVVVYMESQHACPQVGAFVHFFSIGGRLSILNSGQIGYMGAD